MKIKVFEAFSGIGTQRMALRNLGIEHEVVAIAEIDKFAIKSYEAIHGETNNLGDISKINTEDIPDHDLFTYSFPCQDISVAGAVWDKEQLSPTLDTMQGGWRQPSVVVDNPEGIPIKNATKKGYIEACDGDGVDLAYPDSKTRRGRVQKGLSQTLDTGDSKGVIIGASRGRNPKNPSDRTVGSPTEQRLEINKQGTTNTITTVQKNNYVVEGVDVHPFGKKMEFRGYRQKEVSPCLLATDYKAPKTILESQTNNFRIRKLTPKECWRLMGCSDEDFHKVEQVNSNTQLYKQAGNAIVVDVLEGIFSKLFGSSK